MLPDETQPEDHLERSVALPLHPVSQDAETQRKRMLIALGILLLALAAVVLKDWDFWFPPAGEAEEATTQSKSKSKITAALPASTPTAPARERKPAAKSPAPAAATAPFAVTAERAVLPPLQVEVVAGNRHINLPAKSNAIHLDVGSGTTSSVSAAPAPNAPVSIGDRVQLSPQATQSVTVSVPPDYPLLARQMKVQGAVSLQALISREGTIQELQILSGPGILAAAAREAVKQWHFKPYVLNGQPVETQARITVNFTISTN
jgi:TonB family protein